MGRVIPARSATVDGALRESAAGALARSVTTTWWYTFASILLFEVLVLALWVPLILDPPGQDLWWVVAYAAGAVAWVAASVALLLAYRRGDHLGIGARTADRPWWTGLGVPLIVSAAAGVLLWALTDSSLLGATVAAQALCLLRWPPGTRWRITLLAAVVLWVLWTVDPPNVSPTSGDVPSSVGILLYSLLLPLTSALALWWWDVVQELDRSRAAEGRLAATQERLRVAGDVHDLQGHHLQVVALQLELAERLLTRDPDAALEQVRAARSSVDEARQGTRDLATRFRGVPLPDELANAADLMRAAGLRVELDVSQDAGQAPADVLGPVIRETTTNVLRHGHGTWARLHLSRDADEWTYRISNAARGPGRTGSIRESEGSGLSGIADRVGAVGGTVHAGPTSGGFEVVATVPVRVDAENA